jgi:plastocyanin
MKIAAVVAAAALLVPASPARGALDGDVVRAVLYRYVPDRPHIEAGQALSLQSFDVEMHSMTADQAGPDGRPLFDTPYTGVGLLASAQVSGVATLDPGAYPFHCTFHPQLASMRGVLDVV